MFKEGFTRTNLCTRHGIGFGVLMQFQVANGKLRKSSGHWRDRVEALLLEEKLLMVNERKVRDDLRAADDAMLELNKQACTVGNTGGADGRSDS